MAGANVDFDIQNALQDLSWLENDTYYSWDLNTTPLATGTASDSLRGDIQAFPSNPEADHIFESQYSTSLNPQIIPFSGEITSLDFQSYLALAKIQSSNVNSSHRPHHGSAEAK